MKQQRPRYARGMHEGLNRRDFLGGMLAAGAAAAAPVALVWSEGAESSEFPSQIPLYRADFENWCGELHFPNLLTCAPRTPAEVVAVANWAAQNGHALRPRGAMHNWSPLSLDFSTMPDTPLIMADTVQYLNRMELLPSTPPAVRVETGATLEELMSFLEKAGYGFTAMPAVGNITLGGALAIDAHGCAVPALGETALPGQTYGTLSNRILALTAVVWDRAQNRYVLRSFDRTDPEIGALLTHLGRAFITEVTLAVEPDQNLRCVSYVNIPASELFAAPASGAARTLASFLDSAGRIEAIWYAFTDKPWLKVWSLSPKRPLLSRPVSGPYNYPFVDNIPETIVDLTQQIMNGNPAAAPLLGQASYAVTVSGLAAGASYDIWGKSKNLLIWLKPTTLRVHHTSYVVLTRRDRVQRVLHEFASAFVALRDAYQARGQYPQNMPIEIRVTGLDRPGDSGIGGAQTALLSAVAPRTDHPEWDTAVWLSMATLPGTPDLYAFGEEMERWVLGNYTGDYACVRPEWSKGWAYTSTAAWNNPAVLSGIPGTFQGGPTPMDGWDRAIATLDALDPQRIFSNPFLDRLMVCRGVGQACPAQRSPG
jgi:FAD/FMN-containing dehydrogenase